MPASSPRHAEDPSLVALGAAIRRVRLKVGWSQEELAHRTDIDRSYMGSIERGKQNPGVLTVIKLARVLDVTATELMAEARL